MCLGVPGRVVAVSDAGRALGIVDVAGVRREVNLACVIAPDHPVEACVGDWVLVHVGFAMSRIDETEARRTLELLAEIGQLMDERPRIDADAEARDG